MSSNLLHEMHDKLHQIIALLLNMWCQPAMHCPETTYLHCSAYCFSTTNDMHVQHK